MENLKYVKTVIDEMKYLERSLGKAVVRLQKQEKEGKEPSDYMLKTIDSKARELELRVKELKEAITAIHKQ